MIAGLGNMAVNSLLGEQGMDVVKTFFEGYKTGVRISGILYFATAVSVQAFALIYFGLSIYSLSMSLVLLVASVQEHNTKGVLVASVLIILSVFLLADSYNMTCEVCVIGDKGTVTLEYEGGSETKPDYYVTPDGVAFQNSIPDNYVENPYRNGSYGIFDENGKFSEKLRIDPATPKGKKGPSYSHYHIDGGKEHFSPRPNDNNPLSF